MLHHQHLARSVRDAVALFLYATGIVRLATFLRRGLLRSYGVYILSYHHVVRPAERPDGADETTMLQFEQHLRFLTRSFELVSLEHALDLLQRDRLSHDCVVVSFDDGYEDSYSVAFPLLWRFGVPATIFLITGLVGTDQVPWHDDFRARLSGRVRQGASNSGVEAAMERLKNARPGERESVLRSLEGRYKVPATARARQLSRFRLVSWTHVQEMAEHGISFGSHTVDHPNLTRLDAEDLRRELEASKEAIERATGRRCHALAFPNGDFDATVLEAARRAGYRCACTQEFGSNHAGSDLLRLRRVALGDTPLAVLALKLSGLMTPLLSRRESMRRVWWASSRSTGRRRRTAARGWT